MRQWMFAAALAATLPVVVATPAIAQSAADQARWDAAQRRYQDETERYYAERDRYYDARHEWRRGYGAPPPPPPPGAYPPPGYGYNDDRYEQGYDPSRHYRPGDEERVLAPDDRVYRGSDGQYYCKRSDGTTGLIIGAAGGGILGNVIDGGHSRTAGTLIGAALGALAGKAVDQNQSQIRCR